VPDGDLALLRADAQRVSTRPPLDSHSPRALLTPVRGWRPQRTITLISWDAEEPGLVPSAVTMPLYCCAVTRRRLGRPSTGRSSPSTYKRTSSPTSTFAMTSSLSLSLSHPLLVSFYPIRRFDPLSETCLQTDVAVQGPYPSVAGTPSLAQFLRQTARLVPFPANVRFPDAARVDRLRRAGVRDAVRRVAGTVPVVRRLAASGAHAAEPRLRLRLFRLYPRAPLFRHTHARHTSHITHHTHMLAARGV
jgi:hypothetical protein